MLHYIVLYYIILYYIILYYHIYIYHLLFILHIPYYVFYLLHSVLEQHSNTLCIIYDTSYSINKYMILYIAYCTLYIVYHVNIRISYIYIYTLKLFSITTLVWSGHSAPSRAGWSRCPHRYRDSANSLAWQVGRFVSTSASTKNVGVWSLQMYWGFGWLKIFGHVEENTKHCFGLFKGLYGDNVLELT